MRIWSLLQLETNAKKSQKHDLTMIPIIRGHYNLKSPLQDTAETYNKHSVISCNLTWHHGTARNHTQPQPSLYPWQPNYYQYNSSRNIGALFGSTLEMTIYNCTLWRETHQKEGRLYGLPTKNTSKHLANTIKRSYSILQSNNFHDSLGYPLQTFRPWHSN